MSSRRWARLEFISRLARRVSFVSVVPENAKPNPIDLGPEEAWEPLPDWIQWNPVGSLYNPHVWSRNPTYPLSVILVHYNERETLRRCLREHGGQTLGRYQIIVADDGTPGGVSDIVADSPRSKDTLVVVNDRENPGEWRNPAAVLNMAIASAGGRFFVVMSAHILPVLRENLERLMAAQATWGDRRAGSSLLIGNEEVSTGVLGEKIPLENLRNLGLRPFFQAPSMVLTEHACRIGGYSQCFSGWGGEDTLFRQMLHGIGVPDPTGNAQVQWVHLWHQPRSTEDAVRSYNFWWQIKNLKPKTAIHRVPAGVDPALIGKEVAEYLPSNPCYAGFDRSQFRFE